MEDIWSSVTLPHLPSIRRYKVIFVNNTWIELIEDDMQVNLDEGLRLLLSGFGLSPSKDSELSPCFDLSELERRNLMAASRP